MKKRSLKQQLLLSVTALLLCVSMFVGSTFAWFTDTVTSTNNIIKSGSLDVSLEWLEGAANPTTAADTDWIDASKGAIFNSKLWEPGYTEVRHIKIENEGTLALKYNLTITAYNGNAIVAPDDIELAEVIDVYYVDPAQVVTRETVNSLPAENYLGTLDKVLAGLSNTANGTLKPKESATVTLALKMQEDAGNDYQNLSIGDNFAITLYATQLEYENDSFDNTYDEDSVYAEHFVTSADELASALAEGGVVALMNDLELAANTDIVIPKGVTSTLNLNGNDIVGTSANDSGNQKTFTVKGDLTVEGTGTVSHVHTGANMVWNNLTAAFSVEGGTLTLGEGVSVINKGGSDMAYAVDVNSTLGATTLNVNGATIYSTYTGVRLFANNKTLPATVNFNEGFIEGANRDIWNQIASASIPAENGVVNIVDGYKYTTEATSNGGAKYFFTDYLVATDDDGLKAALENNATVILAPGEYTLPTLSGKEGITIEGVPGTVVGGESASTGFGQSNFGKDTTIKNITFTGSSNGVRWSYANGGTTVFENCTFAGDSTYGFHIDQSNGATFIFNDCTFSGFNAFAGDLVKVTFNNCTFLHNGSYGHTNIWSVGEFNNCTFGDKTSVSTAGDNASLYFDGVEESYHHEYVGSVDSLLAVAEAVNNGDSFKGQKVALVNDINLANVEWTPMDHFGGTFDGQGHTISYLTIDGISNVGFFKSLTVTAVVEDVIFDKAAVSGEHYVGVIVGWEGNETYNATIRRCTVQNSTITCDTDAANDNGDKAGAFVGYAVTLTIEECVSKNNTVKAYRDFGGILGYSNGANVIVKNNTVENVNLIIDNEVNYKNYTTDAEHDANAIVGEAAKGKIEGNIVK